MRRLLPVFLAMTLLFPCLAQTGPELVEQAQSAEQSGDLNGARSLWSQAAGALAEEGNEAGQALCLFYRAILEYKAQEYETALTSSSPSWAETMERLLSCSSKAPSFPPTTVFQRRRECTGVLWKPRDGMATKRESERS